MTPLPVKTIQQTARDNAGKHFAATRVMSLPFLIFVFLYGSWVGFAGELFTKHYAAPFVSLNQVGVMVVAEGPIYKEVDLFLKLVKTSDTCKFDSAVLYASPTLNEEYYVDVELSFIGVKRTYTRPSGTHQMRPWRLKYVPHDAKFIRGFIQHRCWWLPQLYRTPVGPYEIYPDEDYN